jgi:hypothetical protein
MTKEAAKKDTTAMTAPPPTTAMQVFDDFGEDVGQGFENQDMSDRKIPMLVVLQSNSPQVVESKGKIHAGQILNTVTGEVFDEVTVVAAITDHAFLAFVPRDDGGGFRGRYAKDSKIVAAMIARNDGRNVGKIPFPQLDDQGRPKVDEKNKPLPTQELVETFEVYAVTYKDQIIDGQKSSEVTGFGVIPFQSTKIKTYKAWNSQIANFCPTLPMKQQDGTTVQKKFAPGQIPLFAHRVKMTTAVETNTKGTYFVPVLSPAEGGDDLKGSIIGKNDSRYIAAKKLHDDVLAGLAKAAYETMTQEPSADPEAHVPF